MKMKNLKQDRPQSLKKKLMSALAMLLISTILMSTTTFAWFVLSTAPEVTGIETKVGANGSLEIVLLNKDTRADMSTIRAGLGGGSLQENQITANNAWGNLIDLGYTEYGLSELTLLPARLDATANGESYSVDLNKLLAVPNYGYDGRIIQLTRDTASAIYQETGFLYSGAQDYGVRAIGTSDALSPQGSALNSAKTNIATWTKSAKSGAQAALTKNMEGLFAIIMQKSTGGTFNDDHKGTLDSMLNELNTVLGYIDSSLRQGLVAYVASEIGSEDLFVAARDRILNTVTPLADLIAEAEGVPAEFTDWVTKLSNMKNAHGLAVAASAELTDGEYEWAEIKGVMANIMNMDQLLINGNTIDSLDVGGLMNAPMIEMILKPGSGLFADVADFADNYVVTAQYMGKNVEMATASDAKPAYLLVLSAAVNTLSPADGGEEAAALPLTATYGYALDLAFRCNAAMPDLVLQTKGVQRVYNGGENEDDIVSNSGNTQGAGSYMEFTTKASDFNLEQQLALMDAIRVGFVDDQGMILGIAKLNVTSREVTDNVVKAPLYMYDYSFEADDKSDGLILTMGERKLTDNLITTLEQNVAKAVTVVVWLDGDLVDNTMVAATAATSLDGVLNLQFATSAELVPAQDGKVLEYTVDRDGLDKILNGYVDAEGLSHVGANAIATEGQGTYTNVSWNAFMGAYQRAENVNADPNASQIAIRNAVEKLTAAMAGLKEVSVEALSEKAQEVRGYMGSDASAIGAYVVDKGVEGYMALTSYTAAEIADNKGTISGVDNARNKLGQDLEYAKYTDASWNALAAALYQAEAVAMNTAASDDQINSALTALVEAEDALEFAVLFTPYEYNGDLYYMLLGQEDVEDTYDRWYDANFKRIVADVTILKLDAYAKPTTIAQVELGDNIAIELDDQGELVDVYLNPDVSFLEEVFPQLRDVQIKATSWTVDRNGLLRLMNENQYNKLQTLLSVLESLNNVDTSSADVAKQKAEDYIEIYETGMLGGVATDEVLHGDADIAIKTLNDAVVAFSAEAALHDDNPMNDNMRLLLTDAINAAHAVEDYDKNTALKTETEAAESLLATGGTNKEAAEALSNLNDELGDAAVTADNTIVHSLPGFDSADFAYAVDYPGITVKLTGNTGVAHVSVTILTEDGVVFTVEDSIRICNKPTVSVDPKVDGVATDAVDGKLTVKVGETADIVATLNYADGVQDQETIVSYTWASHNMDIATVTGNTTATVAGVTAGEADIVVTVTTDCGNTYTTTVHVTVEN